MRVLPRAVLLLGLVVQACASSDSTSCLANPEVESALSQLDAPDNLSYTQKRAAVESLLLRYPNDVRIHSRYQELLRNTVTKSDLHALLDKYQSFAADHPNDPEYQYLYARALVGSNTPKAIELLQQTLARDPSYLWPHVGLASIHSLQGNERVQSAGKYSDPAMVRSELDSFLESCPRSLNDEVWKLVQLHASPETISKYAALLRKNLAGDNGEHVQFWGTLWNLEFRAASSTEQERTRTRIAGDLHALENMAGEGNITQLSTLRQGYQLIGDEATVSRIEKEMIEWYPRSIKANSIYRDNWMKQNPWPDDGAPEGKRLAFFRARSEMLAEQTKILPEDPLLWADQLRNLDNLPDATPQQISHTADGFLNAVRKNPLTFFPPAEFLVGEMYLQKGIKADGVPGLVERGLAVYNDQINVSDLVDNGVSPELDQLMINIGAADLLAGAARQLRNPEIARSAIASLQNASPDYAYYKSLLWSARAKFAEAEGRKLDALTMYHTAVLSRAPDAQVGKKDERAENEQRLWKDLGGSDAGYAAWKKVPLPTAVQTSKWKQPAITMPAWGLRDLHGKKWSSDALKSKVVLINVWATWCEPCREELPYLQKLYDLVKNRSDIQIITFNIDDEIGNAVLLVKEKGYSFPVLLAKDTVEQMKIESGIPRNWIVDTQGTWSWDQTILNLGPGWQEEMLSKIESVKTPN